MRRILAPHLVPAALAAQRPPATPRDSTALARAALDSMLAPATRD